MISQNFLKLRTQLLEIVQEEVTNRLMGLPHYQLILDSSSPEAVDLVENDLTPESSRENQPMSINWIEKSFLWEIQFLGVLNAPIKPKNINPKPVLSNSKTVMDVFKEKSGKLLILGEPGFGKTTTLLTLAQDLLKEAAADENQPIPVLLDLNSWGIDQKRGIYDFPDWVFRELKIKYGIRKDIAKRLLHYEKIALLLDGLDELNLAQRVNCIEHINEELLKSPGFNHLDSLVIGSSVKAFFENKIQLRLNGAIQLLPLENLQIESYLCNTGCLNLWQNIQKIPELLELAKVPFLLSLMAVAAESLSVQDWQTCQSDQTRRSYLFNAYIKQMFKREIKPELKAVFSQQIDQVFSSPHLPVPPSTPQAAVEFLESYSPEQYEPEKEPGQGQTRRWLRWLARELKQQHQMDFSADKIQNNWLSSPSRKWIYYLAITVIFVLAAIWPFLLSIPTNLPNIFDTTLRLTPLLYFFNQGKLHFIKIPDKRVNKNNFSIKTTINLLIRKILKLKAKIILLSLLICSLLLLTKESDLIKIRLILGITGIALWVLISVIEDALIEPEINIKKVKMSNDWIWQAIHSKIFHTLKIDVFFIIILLFIVVQNNYFPAIGEMIYVIIYSTLLGLAVGFLNGRAAIVEHFILRLILWLHGDTPWNYRRFLNYAAERFLLQKVGRRFRFIHPWLQEHFAKM